MCEAQMRYMIYAMLTRDASDSACPLYKNKWQSDKAYNETFQSIYYNAE